MASSILGSGTHDVVTQAATTPSIGVAEIHRPARSLWKDAWYTFTRDKLAMAGLFVLGFMVVAVLLGPYVYHGLPNEINFPRALEGPSFDHPMGTDDLGRDLLARVLNGGRISIAV